MDKLTWINRGFIAVLMVSLTYGICFAGEDVRGSNSAIAPAGKTSYVKQAKKTIPQSKNHTQVKTTKGKSSNLQQRASGGDNGVGEKSSGGDNGVGKTLNKSLGVKNQ